MNSWPVVLFAALPSSVDARAQPAMSYHRTFGPAVDPITRLGWGLGGISVLVIVVIGALFARGSLAQTHGGVFHSPSPCGAQRRWRYGLDLSWRGISSSILVGCMAWTLLVTAEVSRPPSAPALTVQVTASQWWWSLRYLNADPSRIFTTANEIHIPVGSQSDSNWRAPMSFTRSGFRNSREDGCDSGADQCHVAAGRPVRRVSRRVCRLLRPATCPHGAVDCGRQSAGFRRLAGSSTDSGSHTPSGTSSPRRRGLFRRTAPTAIAFAAWRPPALSTQSFALDDSQHDRGGLIVEYTRQSCALDCEPRVVEAGTRMPAQILSAPELTAVTSLLKHAALGERLWPPWKPSALLSSPARPTVRQVR